MTSKLPHCVRPCKHCPFRKDALEAWLGKKRITQILNARLFVCHETIGKPPKNRLQCAGHMIIRGEQNHFVRLAVRLGIPLNLQGQELVFETKEKCIDHHSTR